MSFLKLWKRRIGRSAPAQSAFARVRGPKQDAQYQGLCAEYRKRLPDAFSPPGCEDRARRLLLKTWTPPSFPKTRIGDVRVFVASGSGVGSPTPLGELSRTLDSSCFDFGSYVDSIARGDLSSRARLQQEVLDACRKAHAVRPFDLAWFSTTYRFTTPETLRAIRAMGVPVAVLNTDEKHQYLGNRPGAIPSGQKPLIGSVDVHLTNSLEAIRWYMAEGSAAYYSPQGFDPDLFRPIDCLKTCDVSFLGAKYSTRPRFIENLRRYGVDVACFGVGWGSRVLSDVEKFELLNRSRINLGMGYTGYSTRVTCVKGRDMEVPGSGNVYLTTYDYELARLWDVGKEILCYLNEADCAEQIHYYLSRPDELAAIGAAARRRALREHTWTARITGLLRWMGILASDASSDETSGVGAGHTRSRLS